MAESDATGGLVARAANRFAGKAEREAASVLSTAQRQTHFLDSPRIAAAMAHSDFAFADLHRRVTSVFLVLLPNRLDPYSRWLRLLVSQALGEIAREVEAFSGPQGLRRRPPGVLARLRASGPHGASAGSEGLQGASGAAPGSAGFYVVPPRRVRRSRPPGGRGARHGTDGGLRTPVLACPPG